MNSRTKLSPEIVTTLPQAEGVLAEIAAIDRKINGIESELNATIDAAKARATQAGAGLLARRKDLANAVATFATLNRAELFANRKSLDLAYGVIGFRQSTQIVQLPRVSQAMTLDRLHEFQFAEGIRIKEEVNKDAMAVWPDERLELVGLKRRQTDAFFIEIKAEDVKSAA